MAADDGRAHGRRHAGALAGLFFASGFAALVYQVLWVRELGLLFGSTAQAAALAIAIFFAGLALGGWFWGRRAPHLSRPLAGFGLLEVGVAVTALGHFLLLDAYATAYPLLASTLGALPGADPIAKALVATVVLLPPATLMGGTFPLIAEHAVTAKERLGAGGSRLYALNTAGSAAGALAAGFLLPPLFGFVGAYLAAVILDATVGLGALLLARREPARHTLTGRGSAGSPAPASPPPQGERGAAGRFVWVVAIASGFALLGVEVVWTRLFAQVLQNSAYTYALVLAAFLLALALGSAVASALARRPRLDPDRVLSVLLGISALVLAASPLLIHRLTDGLSYLGGSRDWAGYVLEVGAVAGLVIVAPGLLLGAVLPYLLRALEADPRAPGELVGRLIAANTVGGIAGALTAGFVLLPTLGAWRSLLVLAAVYPALLALQARSAPEPLRTAGALTGVLAAAALVFSQPQLDSVRLNPDRGEVLVEMREGVEAHVAVVGIDEDRLIRVNNFYTLGSSRALEGERNQTVVPMLLHPDPQSVFYLGVGTGITAGAALAFPVERLVACELLADVIAVAERHFTPWTEGLFTDERVELHAEDGRTCLQRSDERYDLIIADLFTPWKAGTGNLYTREHYATARERLEPGGMYVQWMPLYQVSEAELGIVGATMDEVFEQVTVWRGDLYPERSIVALVGHTDLTPLDPAVPVARGRLLADDPRLDDAGYEALALRFYVGNLTASGLATHWPVNTDSRPHVEYLAPRTHRQVRAGTASFLVGAEREAYYAALRAAAPPAEDPYLAALNQRQLRFVAEGAARSAALAEGRAPDGEAARPGGHAREVSPSRRLYASPYRRLSP